MSYQSPMLTAFNGYPYRNLYDAARGLVDVVDDWRLRATSQNARTKLDWSKAREEFRGGIKALRFCLAPPLVDGRPQAWGESFDPKFKGWLDVAGQLFEARKKKPFVVAEFAEVSACEVVVKLGEATDLAFYVLEQAKNQQRYEALVTAHTFMGGFGIIPRQIIQLIKTEVLIEAEAAWLEFGQPESEPTTPALSPRRYLFVQTMLMMNATTADTRQTTEAIVKQAEGKAADPVQFKRDVAELKSEGFIDTKSGPGGGCWLTIKGLNLAKELQARISAQSVRTN